MLIFSGNQLTLSAGMVTSFTTTNDGGQFSMPNFWDTSFWAHAFADPITSAKSKRVEILGLILLSLNNPTARPDKHGGSFSRQLLAAGR
jgi:hypothetical protein